ncbi:MAG: UDP-N-acetylmuramate--L-alanine ligase [Clostridia bacterium]|nr:UDP-N-acetylmuramate--L-alanine ligase [Clostridia bacterium]
MSGLAVLLKNSGKKVSGSDSTKSENTNRLKLQGIKVYIGHKSRHIKGCDLVVFSGAIKKDNPELVFARKNKVPTIERSLLLRYVSDDYKNVIAVSGTHGKTTTTAMISHIFSLAKLCPTVHLGGMFEKFKGNVLIGGKDFFIAEACEFRDSFLTLSPNVCVITNFEEEHLDYFKTFNKEISSFSSFSKKAKEVCFANISCQKHLGEQEKLVYVGDKNGYHIENVKKNISKKYSFNVFFGDKFVENFSLNVFGEYNIQNALMAICTAIHYKIDKKIIKKALLSFENVHRRFEKVGNFESNIVLIDYAHHPTEIKESIKTCKEVFDKKIICIFQPHTFSRTKNLIDKFTTCFEGVDKLFLVKTYSAREKFDYVGSATYLKEKILENKPDFEVEGDYSNKKTLIKIKKSKFKDCVLLFLGAGNVEEISKNL